MTRKKDVSSFADSPHHTINLKNTGWVLSVEPQLLWGGRERFFFQIIRGLLTQREVSFPVAKWRIVQK